MKTEPVTSLMTFYSGWESYHRGLMGVIAPLSREQLARRAASHHWPIGMIAQHIVANRVWWFQGWMGEGSPDLMTFAQWDPLYDTEQPLRTASELVAGLETTWRMIAAALERWTPDDLDEVFRPGSYLTETEKQMMGQRTRQWIIWHVLEHEIFHGGELSLGLGAHGLEGIYGAM